MLGTLRNWSESWIARLFLALLIVSLGGFFFFGKNLHHVGRSATVVRVGKERVTLANLNEKITLYRALVEEQIKQKVSLRDLAQMGIAGRVLGELVQQAALDEEVAHLNIQIADADVKRALYNTPALQDAQGKFSFRKLEQFLRKQGMTEPVFVAKKRKELKRNQILRILRLLSCALDDEGYCVAKGLAQKRKARVLKLKSEDMPLSEPRPEVLRVFYRENQHMFQRPESRDVRFFLLQQDPRTRTIEDKKTFYDMLEDLRDELADGASIDVLAKKAHAAVHTFKDLFHVPPQEMPNPFRRVFHDKNDLIQDTVRAVFGAKADEKCHLKHLAPNVYLIFFLDAVKPSFIPSLDKTLVQVRQAYIAKEKSRLMLQKAHALAKSFSEQKLMGAAWEKQFIDLSETTAEKPWKEVPVSVHTMCFQMQPATFRVVKNGLKDVFIAGNVCIKNAQDDVLEPLTKRLLPYMDRSIKTAFVAAFLQALRSCKHVDFDKKLLQKVFYE